MSNLNNRPVSSKKKNYFDIYISYHPAQRIQVEHICQQFKKFNLRIWYDKDLIADTENEFDENVHALQTSFLFVCFPSEEYKKNLKNRMELSIALEQEMKIISLNLENCSLPQKIAQIELTEKITEHNGQEESRLLIKYLKNEIAQVSETFKQSYKKTVTAWYDSLGRNSVLEMN